MGAEAARARYGDWVPRLGDALSRLDPLADAAVEALSKVPHREALLDRALGRGLDAVPDAPEPLRALLSACEHLPSWWSRDAIARGGELLVRSAELGGAVLGAQSLVYGYASPAGNKPLVLSGRLEHAAPRRLAETSRFVQAVSEPGGMDRFGPGFAITVKVRLMHAEVRRMLLRSPRYRASDWGAPINQHDMVATILLFSVVVLDGLRKLGVRVTPDEARRHMDLWRLVGWIIGVEESLLPRDEAEGLRIAEVIAATQGPPDDDSRALTRALLRSPITASEGKSPAERARAERVSATTTGLCRGLLGDALADELGVPRTRWAAIVPTLHRVTSALPTAHDGSLARSVALDRGRAYWRFVVSEGHRGLPYDFALPTALAGP